LERTYRIDPEYHSARDCVAIDYQLLSKWHSSRQYRCNDRMQTHAFQYGRLKIRKLDSLVVHRWFVKPPFEDKSVDLLLYSELALRRFGDVAYDPIQCRGHCLETCTKIGQGHIEHILLFELGLGVMKDREIGENVWSFLSALFRVSVAFFNFLYCFLLAKLAVLVLC